MAATSVTAEEIQAGVEYQGPKTLGIARIGVSFNLPAGWAGGLPQGGDTFLVGRAGSNGYIFISAEEATLEAAKAHLSQTLPVDQVIMTPRGEAKISGSRVTNDYTVTGGQVPLEGKATAVIGKTGWGVVVLAVATAEEMPVFDKAAAAIIGSLKIVAPKKPKASTKGYWGAMLGGKRVVRFYHGSGYSEKQQYFICPDGRFAYDFSGGGFSMDGASGAFQSKDGGTWSTSGDANGGTLTLNYNDGRSSTYQLAEQEGKLMIDGQRWLREAINCP